MDKLTQLIVMRSESNARLDQVRHLIKQLEKSLSKAPEGSIRFIRRNENIQYYLRMAPQEKSGRYVRKSEHETIRIYLQKAYEKKALEILKKEERSLHQLQHVVIVNFRENLQKLYSDKPQEVKEFINPIDVSDRDYAKMWLEIPFSRKPIDDANAVFQTNNSEYVRSKSELNIANALCKYGIPYKYECPLELKGGYVIYPDFTVLNSRLREVFYWEHRGMMDDRSYAQSAVKRNKEYIRSGIMVGKKLVITEETLNHSLSTFEIETIIKEYFT